MAKKRYIQCPYKYFQCTFYTQVTETFHSSIQSLGVPALSCRLGPKPRGDARLLSSAQPETSPARAAAGASGDALMETLCMALGLEPGGTVTLQTDRHSWGSRGDHPLLLWVTRGGPLSRGRVGDAPFASARGEWDQRADPSLLRPAAPKSAGVQWKNMHFLLPPPPRCARAARLSGRAGRMCPSRPSWGERVQPSPSPVPALRGGPHA